MAFFDYSDDEWQKIENAVLRSLKPHERSRLLRDANSFRHEMSTKFIKNWSKDFEERWRRVAKLSAELSETFVAAIALEGWTPDKIKRALPAIDKLTSYAIERAGQRFAYEPPLQKFYQDTADSWVNLFGGKLATSSNARTDYSGRAIDFFVAVLNPARKGIKPPLTRSTVDGIIGEEKERRRKLNGKTS
jgi:hypothetical protein